jgi:hypothetical protein
MKIKPLRTYIPWYDKPVLVIVLLLLIPVVGIYGVIRTTVITRKRKLAWLLGLVAFYVLAVILANIFS